MESVKNSLRVKIRKHYKEREIKENVRYQRYREKSDQSIFEKSPCKADKKS